MGEEERIVEYLKAYVKREGTLPTIRRLCRDMNTTAPTFKAQHGSLLQFCEEHGIPIDEQTRARMKLTVEATSKRVKKAERKRHRDSKPSPPVESVNAESVRTPTFELIREDLAIERKAHESCKKRAKQFTKEIKVLALNKDPEISGPIVDALCFEALPTVLEKEFGVSYTLDELCQVELTLRQVQEERERLHAKQIELDDYAKRVEADRLQVQEERRRIEAIPDKAELQKQVERLLAWNKLLVDKNDEIYVNNKNLRTVNNCLLTSIANCEACKAKFQQMMAPYKEASEWFLKGRIESSE
jgi:hypothetical protein